MIRLNSAISIAICSIAFVAQTALADEVKTTTVETQTPTSSTSTKVESNSNAAGNSTSVKQTVATPGQVKTKDFEAKAGLNGASVSQVKTKNKVNADGSVTSSKERESHALTTTGDHHHQSKDSTTVSPDGSSSTVKESSTTTSGN